MKIKILGQLSLVKPRVLLFNPLFVDFHEKILKLQKEWFKRGEMGDLESLAVIILN